MTEEDRCLRLVILSETKDLSRGLISPDRDPSAGLVLNEVAQADPLVGGH